MLPLWPLLKASTFAAEAGTSSALESLITFHHDFFMSFFFVLPLALPFDPLSLPIPLSRTVSNRHHQLWLLTFTGVVVGVTCGRVVSAG